MKRKFTALELIAQLTHKKQRLDAFRFWRYLELRMSGFEHIPCAHAPHRFMRHTGDHAASAGLSAKGACSGCGCADISRTLRYDLRDSKAQDVPNKTGRSFIQLNAQFRVLTIYGLCTTCIDHVFYLQSLRPDPSEYLPLLPRNMPLDIKRIVSDYVQPATVQNNACCYYCRVYYPPRTVEEKDTST